MFGIGLKKGGKDALSLPDFFKSNSQELQGSTDLRRKRLLTANCRLDLDSSAQAIGNFVSVKS